MGFSSWAIWLSSCGARAYLFCGMLSLPGTRDPTHVCCIASQTRGGTITRQAPQWPSLWIQPAVPASCPVHELPCWHWCMILFGNPILHLYSLVIQGCSSGHSRETTKCIWVCVCDKQIVSSDNGGWQVQNLQLGLTQDRLKTQESWRCCSILKASRLLLI